MKRCKYETGCGYEVSKCEGCNTKFGADQEILCNFGQHFCNVDCAILFYRKRAETFKKSKVLDFGAGIENPPLMLGASGQKLNNTDDQ